MIAGAGPGGLEAAVTLAEYGAAPLIYEKEKMRGRPCASGGHAAPQAEYEQHNGLRLKMLDKYGVKINYGTKVVWRL
jgi:flavin-dependent dehydrogenase